MRNIYGIEIEHYDWQKDVSNHRDKDMFILAPTGSGKSVAAYEWAIGDNEFNRIIFTAPVKSLSNERYLELRKMGIDAGIITGDVSIYPDARILCMTQEIYTTHFAEKPVQKVVIDEVHYVFQDVERSRAYIDGIKNTHPSSRMMLLSATLNKDAIKYFERISGRVFEKITIDKRPVPVEYVGGVSLYQLTADYLPALIFAFSRKNIYSIANTLMHRTKLKTDVNAIQELARTFKIQNKDILSLAKRGIGIYFGHMLFKEKLFIETLFRNNLIQAVIGTDALALGVNLPAKSVIFAQLHKNYCEPLTKREFLQMAGRAGRPNLYDVGYVAYCKDFGCGWLMDELYTQLVEKPLEKEQLYLTPDIKSLINAFNFQDIYDESTVSSVIDKEISYLSLYSLITRPSEKKSYVNKTREYIYDIVRYIQHAVDTEEEYNTLKRIYFHEFKPEINIVASKILAQHGVIDAVVFYDNCASEYSQREMLSYLRFYKHLQKNGFQVESFDQFKSTIEQEDEFVFNPEMIESISNSIMHKNTVNLNI